MSVREIEIKLTPREQTAAITACKFGVDGERVTALTILNGEFSDQNIAGKIKPKSRAQMAAVRSAIEFVREDLDIRR